MRHMMIMVNTKRIPFNLKVEVCLNQPIRMKIRIMKRRRSRDGLHTYKYEN